MTEKRFTVDELTITENSQKGSKYLLEYQGGVNALCNRINGLFDKSKRLEKENKELKYKLRKCKDARQSYKQDWKACSSYCDEYKSKISSLKDEVEGLLEENKELKRLIKKVMDERVVDYPLLCKLKEMVEK